MPRFRVDGTFRAALERTPALLLLFRPLILLNPSTDCQENQGDAIFGIKPARQTTTPHPTTLFRQLFLWQATGVTTGDCLNRGVQPTALC